MKTNRVKNIRNGLFGLFLLAGGMGLVGCADEYAAYPGYRGGYYASYGYRPHYGYGYGYYAPHRYYGPYYGSPYYGSPYYGGATVVVSRNRSYSYNTDRYRAYRNRTARAQTRKTTNRVKRAPQVQYDNDDERRYYRPH